MPGYPFGEAARLQKDTAAHMAMWEQRAQLKAWILDVIAQTSEQLALNVGLVGALGPVLAYQQALKDVLAKLEEDDRANP